MRVLLSFDLPITTSKDLRYYRLFRKSIMRDGFAMIQESIYCKLVFNDGQAKRTKERINLIKPPKGNIFIQILTEKQFQSIDFILGEYKTDLIQTTDRQIVL